MSIRFLLIVSMFAVCPAIAAAEQDDSGSSPNIINGPTAANALGWSAASAGVLAQPSSDLQWTASDNGSKIGGLSARDYCARLSLDGGGWRLPKIEELQQVYAGASGPMACGKFTCNAPAEFQLSGNFFWSSTETKSFPLRFRYFKLTDGNTDDADALIGMRGGLRALCVRSSSTSAPPGAIALCKDGTYFVSTSRKGACAGHGGVSNWLEN